MRARTQETDVDSMTFDGRTNVVFVDTAPGGASALPPDYVDEASIELRVELAPLMSDASALLPHHSCCKALPAGVLLVE